MGETFPQAIARYNRALLESGEQFMIVKLLGNGSGGCVYRAQSIKTHKFFAVKLADPRYQENPEHTIHESELLQKVRSDFVVKWSFAKTIMFRCNAYGIEKFPRVQCMGMELMDGDVYDHTIQGMLRAKDAWKCFESVLKGLRVLHSHEIRHGQRTVPAPICHGDIKPGNILLRSLPTGELEFKICDFHLASQGPWSLEGYQKSPMGTVPFHPPERPGTNNPRRPVYGGHEFDPLNALLAADVATLFLVTMWIFDDEEYRSRQPWEQWQFESFWKNLRGEPRLTWPLADYVDMIDDNPNKRPNVHEIIKRFQRQHRDQCFTLQTSIPGWTPGP